MIFVGEKYVKKIAETLKEAIREDCSNREICFSFVKFDKTCSLSKNMDHSTFLLPTDSSNDNLIEDSSDDSYPLAIPYELYTDGRRNKDDNKKSQDDEFLFPLKYLKLIPPRIKKYVECKF